MRGVNILMLVNVCIFSTFGCCCSAAHVKVTLRDVCRRATLTRWCACCNGSDYKFDLNHILCMLWATTHKILGIKVGLASPGTHISHHTSQSCGATCDAETQKAILHSCLVDFRLLNYSALCPCSKICSLSCGYVDKTLHQTHFGCEWNSGADQL